MESLKRLFLALWPPGSVQRFIFETYSSPLDPNQFRIVSRSNIHLTLLFLGSVGEPLYSEIRNALHTMDPGKEWEMQLGSTGCFGQNVAWVGLEKGGEEATVLCKRIRSTLSLENGKFHPHFTIARFRKDARNEGVKKVMSLPTPPDAPIWKVREFTLVESRLGESGASYTIVERFSLRDNGL